VDVFKIDVEGHEWGLLPELPQMCSDGTLSLSHLLVEIHVGGWSIAAGGHLAREWHDIAQGLALSCGLMQVHKDPNPARDGRDIEISWVSQTYAAHVAHARVAHKIFESADP